MKTSRNNSETDQDKTAGFTLIETCLSLLIVILGIIFISRILIHTLDAHKKSNIRLEIAQKFQFYTHFLISRPYDSTEIQMGNFTRQEDRFTINWQVSELSPTLKKINLEVKGPGLSRQGYFYKSKTIRFISLNTSTRPLQIRRRTSPEEG